MGKGMVGPPEAAAPETRPADWYPWTRGSRETVAARFPVPAGCRRLAYPRGSFPDWVQHLPLRRAATVVDYRGTPIATRVPVLALVDVDIFPAGKDLQQCADYGIRLGYEYLARFYPDRPVFWPLQTGTPYRFAPSARERARHLTHLFSWLGTFGLKAHYPSPSRDEYQPGDLLVGNSTGAIGHAVVVHDVVACGGERRYLVSQSWIPAQSPHIPKLGEEPYVPRAVVDAFVRETTGDSRVSVRRLPGIPEATPR
jgi:hypothetical protein